MIGIDAGAGARVPAGLAERLEVEVVDSGCRRVHLVEATAPIIPEIIAPVRPWLASVLRFGGSSIRLYRHALPWPLVIRLVHQSSVMQQVEENSSYHECSKREHALLQRAFGPGPWGGAAS